VIPALLLLGVQAVSFNGGFEEVDGRTPSGWRPVTYAGRANLAVVDEGRTGRGIRISSTDGADASWSANVAVFPYSKYRLTFWMRTENVAKTTGRGAGVNFHSRPERSQMVEGTTPWTEQTMEFETGASDSIQVNAIFGFYGQAKGTAWYDDFSLILLEKKELHPSVALDFSQKKEPISPYIYSQFIEHLGKCIYGGIWAEMLDDRKFYYSVGSGPSPWKGATVAMVREDAFVGEHSPRIEGSLKQGKLWLKKGQKYSGHIWLNGDGKKQQVELSLTGCASVKVDVPARGWHRADFSFIPHDSFSDVAEFAVESPGPFRIGTASLMPVDNVQGMRADVLKLLRELNAPLYRWPGGNFVSGYDWHDGIGDPDRRPPRKNPAWQGIEPNDFGTHEFLAFCDLIKTEPLIVVNTGLGDAHTAASWVEYVNGKATTEEGDRRANNGRHEPWNVKWWGIGNEMFGSWQLGYMAQDQYVLKHNLFFDRMTKVDPSIKTIGVGEVGDDWSKNMLTDCADQMTLISEHFYCQEQPGVMAHVALIPNAIKAKVDAHRRLRETLPKLKGKDIRIAMDEWNYWYGPHVFGELGTRYFVKDGLGIAAGLHEFYKNSDIVAMAQYAQTVNVIGAIKTTPTDAQFETTGLVLKLYRNHFGAQPVVVTGTPEPLYVSAALTADGKALTLAVVNPTGDDMTLPIDWAGRKFGESQAWEIAHPDPMAHNDPGHPMVIDIKDRRVGDVSEGVQVKPYSVTMFRLSLR
jgi:alpha-N-arabinofuranosidase